MAYVIFDLEGTVIDSTHRQATLPDGSLDLAHWSEHNKPEKIMQDSLLPLARIMRGMKEAGHKIIICTARAAQQADFDFCEANALKYDAFLHREHGNMEGDASLKVRLLSNYFKGLGFESTRAAKPVMFDDNLKVINALGREGVTMYNATIANENLAFLAA